MTTSPIQQITSPYRSTYPCGHYIDYSSYLLEDSEDAQSRNGSMLHPQ
jgi:hypothetical protein